mgnify:CR=1 FL=1
MKAKLLFLGLLLVSCNSDEKPSVQDDLILSPSYIVMYNKGELMIDDRVDFLSIVHTNKATGYCVSFLFYNIRMISYLFYYDLIREKPATFYSIR